MSSVRDGTTLLSEPASESEWRARTVIGWQLLLAERTLTYG